MNLYGFVGNNGVNWVDVLGLLFDCDDCDGEAKGTKKAHVFNDRITVQGMTDQDWLDFWKVNAVLQAVLTAGANMPLDADDIVKLAATGGISGDGNAIVLQIVNAANIRKAYEDSLGKEVSVDYQCYECGSCCVIKKAWEKSGEVKTATSSASKKTADPAVYQKLKSEATRKAIEACKK